MASLDQRGAQLQIFAHPSTGLRLSLVFKDSGGSAIDITGQSVSITLANGDDESPVINEYQGTITDAANGAATITVAGSYFAKMYGEEVAYSVKRTDSAGIDIPEFWGLVTLSEAA